MNGTSNVYSTTEMRRKYPKDTEGVKDEWRALIKHQTEINELIGQRERELKGLKQQELGQAYNQKLHDLIKSKEFELMQKHEEARVVQARTEQFHRDVAKQQEEKHLLQNHLADDYANSISYKHQNEQYQRVQKLEEDKKILDDAKMRMEEARRRELQKQEQYYNVFNDEIRRAEEKNIKLLGEKIEEKLDYRDQIRDNERKQILKEENYKNFFKLSADNQKKLMDLHAKNVLSPQIEKEKELDLIVDQRVYNEREKQLMEEINRRKWREDRQHETGNVNKERIDYHDYLKSLEKAEKGNRLHESQKQSHDYQDFLKSQKYNKHEQQKAYKDFLDKQYDAQQERDYINRMTKDEKKINFGDLQAYKGYDPKLNSLIPGFMHSKYTNPLGGADGHSPPRNTMTGSMYPEAGASQEFQQSNYNPNPVSSSPTKNPSVPNLNNNYSQQNGIGQATYNQNSYNQNAYNQNPLSPSRDRAYNTAGGPGSPQKFGGEKTISDFYALRPTYVGENYTTMSQQPIKQSYNPITNPLPVNVQNPYIQKEIGKLTQKRPYFANMASTNLV